MFNVRLAARNLRRGPPRVRPAAADRLKAVTTNSLREFGGDSAEFAEI
jgi:hypothetical protein